MKVKNKSFSGGYTFNLEGKPQDRVVELETPSKVVVPLKQGFGREVEPNVEPGEEVKAGQIIGRDDESLSTPIQATVSGTVTEITDLPSNRRAVVIESDGTDDWQQLEDHSSNWNNLSAEEIEELLYTSGVTSLDNQGIPTRYKSSSISKDEVEHIIIEGTESNPYNLSLSALLEENKLSQFVDGLQILHKVFPQAKVHVTINENRQQLIKELSDSAGNYDWIQLYSSAPKYPQGKDEILVPTILGDDYKVRASVASYGVIVLKVQTILHIYDAVVEGKPLIERMVSLAGEGWQENIHLKVRIGTSIEAIMKNYSGSDNQRLIIGNLLTDKSIADYEIPVDRTFDNLNAIPEQEVGEPFAFARPGAQKYSYSNSFLSALLSEVSSKCDTNVHGEERACIFCGYCEDACPVDIIPHLVERYTAQSSVDEELIRYGIFDCIECNLCTFVCPSKRPVGKHIKQGKQFLLNKGYVVK
ncbi:4Fe-4S dicluster domain-containing protein [Acetohalobium arabaticum]|uniref:Na-translocating NADH-quinone reductase subunit A n=1 Tax=Acetohalobium arabaticum (strain ATCC 49924 / DSM 5501 / Z-7288) TaxID=574087 RepID=D9QUB6_ACEAZ|nr:4Fe-4S dicluster domain-containing protein [Acetohalobium arabaticum]ADL11909.1 Na-translocating NADH-quinone reductase subunit A [Acetohalobium arabaticum DSM 5501]